MEMAMICTERSFAKLLGELLFWRVLELRKADVSASAACVGDERLAWKYLL